MKKIEVKMPNPCQKDWEGMTPSERGRFCSHCETEVLDFTTMPEEEIFAFFKNYSKSNTKACGCFTHEQLEKGIVPRHARLLPLLRQAASITLIGLSVAGLPLAVNGQEVAKEVTASTPLDSLPPNVRVIEVPAEYTTITKRVLVEKGGFPEWRETSCTETKTVPISTLQQQLKITGYYEGPINNTLTEETRQAVIRFREEHGLEAVFNLDNDTIDMLDIRAEQWED